MNNYVVQVKVEGVFTVTGLQCESEEEALEKADKQFVEADFNELSAAEYGDTSVEICDDGTYSVSIYAYGFFEPEIEAENREEAEALAMERAINADFGPLEDVDLELQDYYADEIEELFEDEEEEEKE